MTETFSQIIDQSDLKKYRTEIPNIIDDLGLSPAAIRLYLRMKRVAGASGGECRETTRQLADHCCISIGQAHKAKKELADHNLISIDKYNGKHGITDTVYLLDIWSRNFEYFNEKQRSKQRSISERSIDSVQNSVHSVNAQPDSVHIVNASVQLVNAPPENETKSDKNSVQYMNVLKELREEEDQEKEPRKNIALTRGDVEPASPPNLPLHPKSPEFNKLRGALLSWTATRLQSTTNGADAKQITELLKMGATFDELTELFEEQLTESNLSMVTWGTVLKAFPSWRARRSAKINFTPSAIAALPPKKPDKFKSKSEVNTETALRAFAKDREMEGKRNGIK